MTDPAASPSELRSALALLEPLRRRVIRVYWTRGLLALLLLSAASALAVAAGVASVVWVARATGGSAEGELLVRIVPLLLAFVAPAGAIALLAALAVRAIVRGFGRATVLEYESRFRQEAVAPLLRAAVPGARLDLEGRIDEAALEASALFGPERIGVAGELLLEGEAGGVPFAASMLQVRPRRRRLGRRPIVFQGFVGKVDLPGRFDSAILVSDRDGGGERGGPRRAPGLQAVDVGDPAFDARFKTYAPDPEAALRNLRAPVRALLLELAERAGAQLGISLHAGGMTIAVAARRRPFTPRRVQPNDAREVTRQAALYALVAETARALAALPL